MKEKEFNLLDEPWIRVLLPNYTVREVSLPDALLHAQEYTDLAGETPTQDVAVLRLLLAVLHSVFGRKDADGKESEIKSINSALLRWRSLWETGCFPRKPLCDYFSEWYERFWLFHPEIPFWQVPEAKIGIDFDAKKLNGEVSESGHKDQLFSNFSGYEKDNLSYAQAARWLLYINGYDEKGGRPKKGNKPRPGIAWLGQIGFVAVKGRTLFETLMRNLVFLRDAEKPWDFPKPIWEQPPVGKEQSRKIAPPKSQAELLTLQSRRIILKRKDDKVIGHILLGGDYFDSKNAFVEQMTIWRENKKSGSDIPIFFPQEHDVNRQMWREFPIFFQGREPGVVRWNVLLQKTKILNKNEATILWAVMNRYDSNGASVKDIYSDTITFHLGIIDELGIKRRYIIEEVICCEKLADQVGFLAKNLALASGGNGEAESKKAKEQFYFQIDQPFREWLYRLDPDWDDEESEKILKDWQNQAKKIARRLGEQMVLEAGTTAFVGRTVEVKKKNGKKGETEKRYYCAPKAYNSFLYWVNAIYGKGETKHDGSNGSGTGKKPGPAEN